uniref:Type I restriction enzyme R protein N terminus (HSDR_N) n=1 Tax=Candidatus Kentrum sp. LPFa TaxID=2126335 RepID=A0A450X129_9GAMM|nr:MAG: hypothetical protein BECKLPF1236B_GA0070989_13364 [Candidatus Kentron sp. LPFa]
MPSRKGLEYTKKKLEENVPLALAVNTEKARSEFIIAFVLLELRSSLDNRISLFSGIDFEVDREKRLTGFCDFIISLSTEQLFLTTPVVMVVEAKNENIIAGIGQCLAEMVASKLFNESERNGIDVIYGVVTTGSAWRFLKLAGNTAFIDKKEYHIDAIDRIMGILTAMVGQLA